jgi:hypothetical protein
VIVKTPKILLGSLHIREQITGRKYPAYWKKSFQRISQMSLVKIT